MPSVYGQGNEDTSRGNRPTLYLESVLIKVINGSLLPLIFNFEKPQCLAFITSHVTLPPRTTVQISWAFGSLASQIRSKRPDSRPYDPSASYAP